MAAEGNVLDGHAADGAPEGACDAEAGAFRGRCLAPVTPAEAHGAGLSGHTRGKLVIVP